MKLRDADKHRLETDNAAMSPPRLAAIFFGLIAIIISLAWILQNESDPAAGPSAIAPAASASNTPSDPVAALQQRLAVPTPAPDSRRHAWAIDLRSGTSTLVPSPAGARMGRAMWFDVPQTLLVRWAGSYVVLDMAGNLVKQIDVPTTSTHLMRPLPDGRSLLFWSSAGEEVRLIDTQSGFERRLTALPGSMSADLSPDLRHLGYIAAHVGWTQAGASAVQRRWATVELLRLSDGSRQTLLEIDVALGSAAIAWSPDGRYLLVRTYSTSTPGGTVVSPHDHFVIDIEGNTAWRAQSEEEGWRRRSVWAGPAKLMLGSTGDEAGLDILVDLETGARTEVSLNGAVQCFSPSGRFAVLDDSYGEEEGYVEIRVQDLEQGRTLFQQRVAAHSAGHCDWSDDERVLLLSGFM